MTRRAALQLGAGAGVVAATAPYVAKFGERAFDLGNATRTASRNLNWPAPPIITRAQWGANESLRREGRDYDNNISKMIVHHTGTPNSVTNYASLCRGILSSETSGEYIDIAYNWLIDPNGNIYEGRWAGDYAPGQVHSGEGFYGFNVRGAHAIYHNTNTIGIALMGTYDTVNPPAPMVEALVKLLAWKCARWGVDPLGRGTYNAANGAVENLYNICGHRDTSATDCPGQRTQPMLPAIRTAVAARIAGGGYWIASYGGPVIPVGGAPAGGPGGNGLAGIAGRPQGDGYWLYAPDGSLRAFGGAKYLGSLGNQRLNAPIVSMCSTATGNGYWMLGGDGHIYRFGDAGDYGSPLGWRLNGPVLGIAANPAGHGYWVVARDGGVFGFGDARFYGSAGGWRLNLPVIAMAARPQGDGYWLLGGDGGIFAFGAAPHRGAIPKMSPPAVAILPSTSGNGYAVLRSNGAVSTFGDAPFIGDAVGRFNTNTIGFAGKLQALT